MEEIGVDAFQEEFQEIGGEGRLWGAPVHEKRTKSLVYWMVIILRSGQSLQDRGRASTTCGFKATNESSEKVEKTSRISVEQSYN